MISEANKQPGQLTFLEQLSADERRYEKLCEAVDQINNLIDPMEAYRQGDEIWLPLGKGFNNVSGGMVTGMLTAGFETEAELALARDEMRYMAGTNPYAINAHENRVSYIVGDGHTYDVAAKKAKGWKAGKKYDEKAEADDPTKEKPTNEKPSADLLADEDEVVEVQEAIDEFIEENGWHSRQQEAVLRLDRDGEVFIRYFPGNDGVLRVRFVEPGHVATPTDKANNPNVRFGIEFDPDDAETAIAYCIKGQWVPAEEIQHRKANVDSTTPRGVPLLFGQRHHLRRANKNVLNISAKVDVISAIAIIRKHNGSRAGVESTVAGKTIQQRVNPNTGATVNVRPAFSPGTILDVPNTAEYDAPQVDGIDQLIQGVALNLRCIASRLVMPEFMVSSDASNANYASTMVAEGPSVKMFERLQKRQSCWDLQVMWRVLEAKGITDAKKRFEIRVGMPTIISRDDYKKAQENEILYGQSIISTQEWCSQLGIDYEKMQEEIEAHKAAGRTYKPGEIPLPFGGDPNANPLTPSSRKPGEPKGEPTGKPPTAAESVRRMQAAFAEAQYP